MHSIEINKLVKQYKNGVRALENLSLNVNCGEVFTLLGPNGAGKSTLINILTTLYKPTSGNVIILGRDLSKEPAWVRTQIACAEQRVSIDEHLSLMENMIFQSRIYKVDNTAAKKRINTLIESFDLSQYLKYPVASYSGGVKHRLDIAMNMVSYPKILFLDEPTVGMDIISRKSMWKIVKKIRDDFKTTVFMTTHYLEEADKLSDTICIMKKGHEITQGTPESLKQYIHQNKICISFSDAKKAKECANLLSQTYILPFLNIHENSVFTDVGDDRRIFENLNKWLLKNNIEFQSIGILQPTLEDVFLKLTGTERS